MFEIKSSFTWISKFLQIGFVLPSKYCCLLCKPVNSDLGDGFAENPVFQAGIRQFSLENESSRHGAILLEQGKFATKGIW